MTLVENLYLRHVKCGLPKSGYKVKTIVKLLQQCRIYMQHTTMHIHFHLLKSWFIVDVRRPNTMYILVQHVRYIIKPYHIYFWD